MTSVSVKRPPRLWVNARVAGHLGQRTHSTLAHGSCQGRQPAAVAQSCLCLSRHQFPFEVQLSTGSYSGWVSIRPNLPSQLLCLSLGKLPSTSFSSSCLHSSQGLACKQVHSSPSPPALLPLPRVCVWRMRC